MESLCMSQMVTFGKTKHNMSAQTFHTPVYHSVQGPKSKYSSTHTDRVK